MTENIRTDWLRALWNEEAGILGTTPLWDDLPTDEHDFIIEWIEEHVANLMAVRVDELTPTNSGNDEEEE